ncbi:cytochrome P450 2K4 [Scophthalmus maximus]|uniref:cytochrome P450 2K4 n=1 Tax=Scophthalmus maximus TaxID=52904 RepID=UPI000F309BCF|nr:cytochrome P450 2K4 [Scophthalmus maximus]
MGILELFLQTSSPTPLLGALLVLLLVYLVSSSSFSSEKNGKEPPGPRPLPLLGNLLQLDFKRVYISLAKLSKKYGSVFTVYIGPPKLVILVGYKTVKEALINYGEEFGERHIQHIMHDVYGGQGLIWTNGDSWQEMRRFALTNLRDNGMGKKESEEKIINELHHLTEVINKTKGEAFDMTKPIHRAVSNIICSMVYGNRFEYDDPEFMSLVDHSNKYIKLFTSPSLQMYNMFPWLGKFISEKKELIKLVDANKKQHLKLIRSLEETLNPQMCRGFIDAFLVRKNHLEKSGITNSHFHYENLLKSVNNMFNAGTDTTATTLRWGLLFMARYPEIQDQVQEELSRVIGSRQVKAEDRKNLPFVDAVVHETQRMSSVVPMSLPHKTSQDVTFQGHFIKKGTTVFPLLISVLRDESEWERPHSFYPAHFLNKDGKFVKRDAFMPFSAGRRACPGESLARMELFLFLATLLQHFRFSPPPGVSEEELDVTPQVGFSLAPPAHKLCAVPRM